MLSYRLILIVISVIRTILITSVYESHKLVLIKTHITNVRVYVIVVIVKLTAFTISNSFLLFHVLFDYHKVGHSVDVLGVVFSRDQGKDVLTALVGNVVASLIDVLGGNELDHIRDL